MVAGFEATSAAIRERGLRLTLPRAVVAAALRAYAGHHSVDELASLLRAEEPQGAPLNRSTIYRVLEALEAAGLVVAVRSGQQETRFEWAPERSHHHLICDRCGRTEEVDLAAVRSLEREASSKHGFTTRVRHLGLHGECSGCRASEGAPR